MASPPPSQKEALDFVKEILTSFYPTESAKILGFLRLLERNIETALDHQKTRDPGLVACMSIWTSHLDMNNRQFYSILNEAIRRDIPEIMDSVAALARGINNICVCNRFGTKLNVSPPDNLPPFLVRCATIPRTPEIRNFFQKGKFYRCPMYLATSRDFVKAKPMFQLAPRGEPLVKWEIYLPSLDSFHGNDIFSEFDEGEFLFPPYSVFRVVETPTFSERGTREDLHVIKILAVRDNRVFSEKLPLSPWN